MGIIRKTLSVSTLGIVDFRSKKERIKRAEKAQRKAEKEMGRLKHAQKVVGKQLSEAQKRAEAAELTALKEIKRSEAERGKRRARRKAKADEAREVLEGWVASAQPVIEEQAKELSRRGRKAAKKAAARAEKAQDEAKVLGRRGRKAAEKTAKKAAKRARKTASDVAEAASELVSS